MDSAHDVALRRSLYATLLFVSITACLDKHVVDCGDGRICPAGLACDEAHQGCVLPDQVDSCLDEPEGADCNYRGVPRGSCYDHVCLPSGCGNAILDPGEACDDGNRVHGDGCAADCRSTEVCGNGVVDVTIGESCEPSVDGQTWCRADCVSVRCGDGVVDEAFESCDLGDKNSDAPDAECRPNCQPRRCGDGVHDKGEVCDDKNRVDGDGCSSDCLSSETCGNGVVDTAAGESCDPLSDNSASWCRPDCVSVRCGDGIVDDGWQEECDDGPANSSAPDAQCRPNCQPQRCGDGVVDRNEVCDDGNARSGDGCAPDCRSNETCGNGVVDAAIGESCEPNQNNRGWCRSDCVMATCGDGVLDTAAFEQCDNGTANSAAPDADCRPNCQRRRCGDGIQDSAEVCDDGNQADADGCSHDCRSREVCGNGYADYRVGEECDDRNSLGHDGCSSTCRSENPAWRALGWTYAPVWSAGAYDAMRDVFVSFAQSLTFELVGTGWRELTPPHLPNFGYDAGMAWDARRRTMVVFGGNDTSIDSDETWEWDGRDWRRRAPGARGPAARSQPLLVYDSKRDRTVMFGGHAGAEWLPETWEWIGAEWHEVATENDPPQGTYGATYDPVGGRVVAFDGTTLWTFDGNSWSSQSAPSPSAAGNPGTRRLAYDAARGKLVELTTGAFRTPSYKLYEWSGDAWSLRPAPPGRADHDAQLVYRSARRRLTVLLSSHIWEWDGEYWRYVGSNGSPPARSDGAMSYDVMRGEIVLFGGQGTGDPIAETWIWNGATWSMRTPWHAPPARQRHVMAYDAVARRTLLFGGAREQSDTTRGDTWLWDGEDWSQPVLDVAPPARNQTSMTYDVARKEVVLFGGVDLTSGAYKNDTWSWNGREWIEHRPETLPAARYSHGISYDPLRRRVILVGGVETGVPSRHPPTWTWDGMNWTAGVDGFPVRYAFAMTYDANHQQTLLVSGDFADNVHTWSLPAVQASEPELPWSAVPIRFSRDPQVWGNDAVYDPLRGGTLALANNDTPTWELSYRAEGELYEVCQYGFDVDGDGLIGCADPDCWGYCTPMCPPGAECDESFPHCGDGECNTALETCRLCPEDCACEALCGDFFCDAGESAESCPGDCARPVSPTPSPAP